MPRLSLKNRNTDGQAANPFAALSPQGQALVEEVDQLAGEVLAPEKEPPAPMTGRQAKNMRRTANGFFIAVAALCLFLGLTTLLNAFADNGVMGVRFFVEPTNAMSKAVPYGSLLVTVTRSSSKIRPGDIVTFNVRPEEPNIPGARLTRIVDACEKSGDGKPIFRTKRAGNAAPDSMLINMTNILGVKLFVIPGAGHVVSFVQAYAAGLATLAAAMLISAVLLRRWANREHPKNRKGRVRHAAI
jgi:hypothetical protein